jgi:(R,R)-butanediol dehydrogenase/meso-butanediol dehydrogenase/diacetyl reductase
MRVAVFTDLKKIEFHERQRPKIGSDEVLLEVKSCGICGSDVHGYLHGVLVPLGTVMGHECAGIVAEVGKNVHEFKEGDRVVAKPIAQCGNCYWCKKGQYSLCPTSFGKAFGINPEHDGAFAPFLRVEYPKEMLFKLPQTISFDEGALVEPLATSLHAVRMSRLGIGDNMVILGAGMIGLGVLQFARIGGAGKVIVIEVSEKKRMVASEMGADMVLNPLTEGDALRDRIFGMTGGIGADVVFECAGVPSTFQSSASLVKSGGQVILVGINDKEVPINPFSLVLWEVEMKGALGYYDEFALVIDFLEKRKVRTEGLISDRISLEDLVEKGFHRILSSQDMIKILVRP